ncbi:MAG: hypothetical protein INR72_08020 [Williamsia herbipolensis]|nr:hypothetical protein [Williamsia herbipolensis]
MTPLTKSTVRRVTATAAAVAAVAVIPVAGANAATGDESVAYSPTLTIRPGPIGCAALIQTTKLPQTRSGAYRVQMKVVPFGIGCGSFKVAVDWRNTTAGGTGGQVNTVLPDGSIEGAPGGVIDGFGYAPGAGRIVSTIHTYSQYDEAGEQQLPHIAGTATFTLR